MFAGESAGGGLVVATLVNARDAGLALPAAAFLMSPYADLTLAGGRLDTKHHVDPLLNRELLEPRVADYTSGQDPALPLISPIFADLSGLPPLIIQRGSDLKGVPRRRRSPCPPSRRRRRRGHARDRCRVPHVFQAYSALLDEAAAALDRAGRLLSAHLAGAERVTA